MSADRTPEQIAAGLSKAQKNALLKLEFPTLSLFAWKPGQHSTFRSLVKQGLVYGEPFGPWRINSTGQAVRAIISSENSHDR